MRLTHLYLENFRNYSITDLELKPGITGIFGSNGHGKTNLLEAIHLITQGYSQRTRKVQDFIHWDQDTMLIRSEGEIRQLKHHFALQLSQNGQKDIRVNGKAFKLFSKLLGHYATLSIGPSDIEIVQGGPGERRKFLDALGSQFSSAYLDDLRAYQQILKQRNAFFKSHQVNRDDLWESLTHTFVNFGTQLTLRRLELLNEIRGEIIESYDKISSQAESLRFEYKCSFGLEIPLNTQFCEEGFKVESMREEIQNFFWRKLIDRKFREKDQKMSLYGPHKDDLIFQLKGKSLREFGSQGQQRSTSLALKLAAASKLEKAFEAPPILLLDDIFAELDHHRRKALAERIQKSHQVFVATPERGDLPFEAHQTLLVNQGVIHYA